MEQVRLGIIGIGEMGAEHARCILAGTVPGLRLTAVADNRESRLDDAAKHFPPDVRRFSDSRALMDAGCCDAVLIATPHALHSEIAVYALRHGLHVLTEKPAGVHAPDTDDWAVEQGWISLCPRQVDQTDDEELERLSAGAEAR